MRQTPAGDCRYRTGEIGHNHAALLQKAQKRAQCRDHQLGGAPTSLLGVAKDEAMNIDRSQFIESHCPTPKMLDQKAPHDRQIVGRCC